MGERLNSKIPSIFDHTVRNSSIIEPYYQMDKKTFGLLQRKVMVQSAPVLHLKREDAAKSYGLDTEFYFDKQQPGTRKALSLGEMRVSCQKRRIS